MHFLVTTFRKNLVSAGFLLITLLLTLFILTQVSMEKEIPSLGVFLFKLLPFVFATLSIAYLDLEDSLRRGLSAVTIPGVFLGFFCYFVPKLFFFSNEFEVMYQTMLLAVPYIILALALSYRLGGGSTGATMRLSFGMLLLMISGIEDLAFLLISMRYDPNWAGIPAIWDWASHMTVRVGRPLTQYEAYVFIAVHVMASIIVMFYPFWQALSGRRLISLINNKPGTHSSEKFASKQEI